MSKSDFKPWVDWFQSAPQRRPALPWANHAALPQASRDLIAGPLRLFQLGESSDARHLLRKVERYAFLHGKVDYARAMEAFIAEENHHSDILGRFMALEGIPKAKSHWADGLFRAIRHRLPLLESTTILFSAEVIAIPFYTALRDASPSPVLKAICTQILNDENNHLRFQAQSIRLFRSRLSKARKAWHNGMARVGMELALDLVWIQTGDLFLSVGCDFPGFRRLALAHWRQAWAIARGEAPLEAPLDRGFDRIWQSTEQFPTLQSTLS